MGDLMVSVADCVAFGNGTLTPRVSVICAFFQAERYFHETINSVLAQTFGSFELLLVDDGSTDNSSAIAKDYAARHPERIRYLQHSERQNRGTCASRNLGLENARAELVAFVDADDCWRPSKLEEQVELLDRMPEVDAICGAVNMWMSHAGGADQLVPTGHEFNRVIRPPEALLEVYPLGKADPPVPSDLVIRSSVVKAIGGFEESFTGALQLYEDQAFLAKFFLHGTIYFDERVWLDYRIHDNSCTVRVNRDGMQPVVRRYCLEWFETYLASTRFRFNPRIRLALARALGPYRHPGVAKAVRELKRVLLR
jgi:glycosyltransferase involved in cell wall biosynthesis